MECINISGSLEGAHERLNAINDVVDKGGTILIATCARAWEVHPKTIKAWKDAGLDYFKIFGRELYMLKDRSRKYVCITGCAIRGYIS